MSQYKDRLQSAMTDTSVTTSALAKHLGLSYQAVRKVVLGTSKAFTAENNEAASAYLGVTSKWLATGIGPRLRSNKNVTKLVNYGTVPLISWRKAATKGLT